MYLDTTSVSLTERRAPGQDPLDSLVDVRWYAIYTSANHEKRIAAELERRSIECFLPLYSSVRRWKDRRVKLDLPLFPSYVFLHFALRDRLRALQIPGVARFVGFGSGATAIPELDIARIRDILNQGLRAEPHPYLTVGRRVRIQSGPLAGLEGILRRRKNKLRFVVSLQLIQRSVSVELEEENLATVKASA